ncbi:MAG TPA: ribose-5-phosphate isomerase RpiA [Chlamydiales bacterium]|nr:ribose-5-phosphate isomerase RpiA [Chlamydiales bacterium]
MSNKEAKRAAGREAAKWIEPGMIVGLGTGSTATYFIESLIERVKKGLKIQAVASSHESAELARDGGIELLNLNDAPRVDVTVDGADEIDSQKRMIKGGGGAHVREKILAAASREMVVIVDESKLVSSVGVHKLPVEILFFGAPATRKKIENAGYKGQWRTDNQESFTITENGNLLFDIEFPRPPQYPEQVHATLRNIPGVLDTGFFFGYAGRVIVGYSDGTIKILA